MQNDTDIQTAGSKDCTLQVNFWIQAVGSGLRFLRSKTDMPDFELCIQSSKYMLKVMS